MSKYVNWQHSVRLRVYHINRRGACQDLLDIPEGRRYHKNEEI